jgi:hypothetical protein
MLNLNFNIIGSIKPRPFSPFFKYVVRNDEFKDSLVVAMPGTLFLDEPIPGVEVTAFGMQNPWDDISSYVRGGTDQAPIGNDLGIIYSQSFLPNSLYPTSSTAYPGVYPGATRMSGANSFYVTESFATGSGTNLDFKNNWVIESWVAFEETGSFFTSGGLDSWTPNRFFAWKYNIGNVNSSYIWDAINTYTAPGVPGVSGSLRFVYNFDNVPPPGSGEVIITPSTGSALVPYQWRHVAISYTTGSGPTSNDRTIRQYINGNLISSTIVNDTAVIRVDVNEPMQIMGSLDSTEVFPGGYSGSAVSWQDYRLYNGTNKNYTGSIIPIPESMVTTLILP